MALPGNPNITAQAEQLAAQGRVADAFATLTQASDAGDAMAVLTLADWRMSGAIIRRDLGEARRLYQRAAELGVDDAAPVHIALLANGAGGTGRDWPAALDLMRQRAKRDPLARRQLALLEAMAIDSAGEPLSLPPESIEVQGSPRIFRCPGFLTPAECDYIAQLALPLLSPAVVVDPRTGRQIRDPVRTAFSVAFPFVDEDPVLHAINRRIALATGTCYEQGEPLQVLSYQNGQEYGLHSDTLPGGHNQRTLTFLVALSDGFSGGETSFPRLGLELRLTRGEALCFANTDAAGNPDERMWHAGRPVPRGHKLLLSKWIRQSPLDISGPSGRPF